MFVFLGAQRNEEEAFLYYKIERVTKTSDVGDDKQEIYGLTLKICVCVLCLYAYVYVCVRLINM